MEKIAVNIQRIDNNLNDGKINYNKVITSNKEGSSKKNDKSCDVNISKEGILRNRNSQKKAGTTSTRDAFENSASEIRDLKSQKIASGDISEIWKLDEPETYEKWVDAQKKLYETRTYEENGLTKYEPIKCYDDLSEEGKYYQDLASSIINDYLSRRFYNSNSPARTEVDSIQKQLDELDKQFSDDIHDVAFNLYSGMSSIDDMWQANTKFSVSLSKNMLNILSNGTHDNINILMSSINECVKNLKDIDLRYEGDFEWLRFGVKLQDDWKATYYANFTGCKEPDGIQAESADELLQMLIYYKK